MLDRNRIYCWEKETLEELYKLPRDIFCARNGLLEINDLEQFVAEHPHGSFSFSLRLRGGKGGFGTLLKSFRINKSSNQLMCRDLSGRRLADVEEEKKLKKWVETAGEREKEKQKKKKAKHEKLRVATREKPKHDFNDPDYIKTREDILEKTDDAFEDGFKKLRRKRKLAAPLEESSSSDEDDGKPGTSAAMRRKEKRSKKAAKIEESSGSDEPEKKESPLSDERAPAEAVEEQLVEVVKEEKRVVEPTMVEPTKKIYEKPQDIPTDFAAVDLDKYDAVKELEALGLHRLKHALEARGLKCGGSLQERAARLFSVKGIKKENYPKAIVAPPPKKNKK